LKSRLNEARRRWSPKQPRFARRRSFTHAAVLAIAVAGAVLSAVVAGVEEPSFTAAAPPSPDVESSSRAASSLGYLAAGATAEASPSPEAANEGGQVASATPAPDCVPGLYASYCVYTVQEGDTLSSIADHFGLGNEFVAGWDMLVASNQPEIVSADDFLQPGQNLRIPTGPGIVHTVILGETVGDLAEQYDANSAEIIDYNALGSGNLIAVGQVILIPNPRQLAPEPVVEPTPEPSPEAPPEEPPPGESSPPPAEETPPPPTPVPGFIWPVNTNIRITNHFDASHPLGIDIGLRFDPTAPILAVQSGTVTFAGGDPCCSYGLYVIVDHGDGLKTLYAHLSRIDVSVGQSVGQGEQLGVAGSTGYSTGVHLHFEVHLNGKRIDPLSKLPE
jgi:murein DD-endopeptidase MepM/ murein hydrolase activator NlpD